MITWDEHNGALPHDRSLPAPGQSQGPRITLVHGFTQTRRCWHPIDEALATNREVLRLDAPGHGAATSTEAGLEAAADLVVATGGRGAYLGYSMGGRIALHAALRHPDQVEALILVGATPGIIDDGKRAKRVAKDEALALRIEQVGVGEFLDEWLALPLFAGLSEDAAHRHEREHNTPAGLASSLRLVGTGMQRPLWDELSQLEMPTLLVAGAQDTKFAMLAHAMAETIGENASVALIPGAGHTAHLEQPDSFLAEVQWFLQ